MRNTLTVITALLFCSLFSGCSDNGDDGSPTSDLRGEASSFNVDGTWDGRASNGLQFVMRLNQQGSSVGGDIAVNGLKVPLVGGMEGNVFFFEADLTPTTFGEAEVNEASTSMQNGVLAASGTTIGSWSAVKRN